MHNRSLLPAWIIRRPGLFGCLLLALVTLVNNWPVAFFDFAWDDQGYIIRNYPIQDPPSLTTLWWCLTEFAEANWHPLTWFALNLQFAAFGFDPRGYHVVNLLLHVANVLLLYHFLHRSTGAAGKSLFVAALFAVHPLHVESVAWISEIKDVLSTLFFMLCLNAYATYSRRPGPWRYALVALYLALGLMAKPMLVTLPFVLLLLDFWPLGRLRHGPQPACPDVVVPRVGAWRLVLEKAPLFLMVAGACVLTFMAQKYGGAMAPFDALPLATRLSNVANSYMLYLWRMVYPWPLSFFYPYNVTIPAWRVATCAFGICGLTAAAFLVRRSLPSCLTGWLWFLGTLVPVIGIIQVGSQSLADRYTYIPSIGIFLIAAWLGSRFFQWIRLNTLLPTILAGSIVFAFMVSSFEYLLHWQNEKELYGYALTIDPTNHIAHNNYANILAAAGDFEGAITHFTQANNYSKGSIVALNNMAMCLFNTGKRDEAIKILVSLFALNSPYYATYVNLAACFFAEKNIDAGINTLYAGLALASDKHDILEKLASGLLDKKRYDEASELLQEALRITYDKDPRKISLLYMLAHLYNQTENCDAARQAYQQIIALQPTAAPAYILLARTCFQANDQTCAVTNLKTALRLKPDSAQALESLGDVYFQQGRKLRALTQYRRALAISGTLAQAWQRMAEINRAIGRTALADIQAAKGHELRMQGR